MAPKIQNINVHGLQCSSPDKWSCNNLKKKRNNKRNLWDLKEHQFLFGINFHKLHLILLEPSLSLLSCYSKGA